MEISDSFKYEQLFFFVFGISIKESDDKKKCICVEKAYRDFCRTIKYQKDADVEKKASFKEKTTKLIINLINNYPVIDDHEELSFDDWHRKAIEGIIELSEKFSYLFRGSEFITVGQAQKWLNMSIKYMRMMDVLNERMEPEFIHVPIDNYIIDAVKKQEKIAEQFNVEGLGIKPTFSESWSRIDNYDEYSDYQQKIREELKIKHCLPIDWESEVWMAEATHKQGN